EAADADVQKVALGEVPAVAAEVGLGEQLGRAATGRQLAQQRRPDAGLALARHHDGFLGADLANGARDWTVVPARADHDLRRLGDARADQHDDRALAAARDAGHTHAFADDRAGLLGATQQVLVELAPDDAVADDAVPARLEDVAVELDGRVGER